LSDGLRGVSRHKRFNLLFYPAYTLSNPRPKKSRFMRCTEISEYLGRREKRNALESQVYDRFKLRKPLRKSANLHFIVHFEYDMKEREKKGNVDGSNSLGGGKAVRKI